MKKTVQYFDYPAQFLGQQSAYMEIIQDVLSKGSYILGEDLARFEKNLALFAGSKFAVGVSNGTDSILLSLLAAGIGPGDEVISVSHTFVATIEVVKLLGATPVFVDIADDHNMNVKLVENAVTPKTKAVIPVQLNGRICADMDELVNVARERNLLLIEDSAQSLGAKYKGKRAGTFGLSGSFSFYPAKLLGAFGDAGIVVTDDEEHARKVTMLRDHGRDKVKGIGCWGLNCRMDNLQAAILDFRLKQLPENITRRRQISGMYHEGLSSLPALRLPAPPAEHGDFYDVFQNYELEAERSGDLVAYLGDKGVGVIRPWGGRGVHQYEALGLGNVSLPRTEELFQKAVMLPMYPELSNEDVSYIIDMINAFYNK